MSQFFSTSKFMSLFQTSNLFSSTKIDKTNRLLKPIIVITATLVLVVVIAAFLYLRLVDTTNKLYYTTNTSFDNSVYKPSASLASVQLPTDTSPSGVHLSINGNAIKIPENGTYQESVRNSNDQTDISVTSTNQLTDASNSSSAKSSSSINISTTKIGTN